MANDGLQSLSGKRVLISGGSQGIGLATAKHLLDVGAKVAIFSRSQANVDAALVQLPGAFGVAGDQAKHDDVHRVFETIDRELGGLDAVVINAGIAADTIIDKPYEEYDYAIHTNLLGPMHVAKHAIDRLKANGGNIVGIGSMSAKTRDKGSDVYIASKSGLRGFLDSIGRQVGDFNIGVTLIEPGLVHTEMTKKSDSEDNERREKLEMIEADDVARVVLFALSQPRRCLLPFIQVRPLQQKI